MSRIFGGIEYSRESESEVKVRESDSRGVYLENEVDGTGNKDGIESEKRQRRVV